MILKLKFVEVLKTHLNQLMSRSSVNTWKIRRDKSSMRVQHLLWNSNHYQHPTVPTAKGCTSSLCDGETGLKTPCQVLVGLPARDHTRTPQVCYLLFFVFFCLESKAKGLRRPVFHRIRHRVHVPLCGSRWSSSKGPTPRIASLHVTCFSMFSPSSGTQSSGSRAKLDLYRRRG